MKKITFVVAILIGVIFSVSAQQLPQFRYQEFNSIFLNPASIGKANSPDIYLNHRSQWVGFSGAPTISSLAGKYRFREDMAAGAFVSNDLTGPTRRTFINLNYSYILKTGLFNISFGLGWTVTNYRVRGDLITLHEQGDNSVVQNLNDAAWKPDANAGIMLYSDKFFAGLGIQQLFKSKFKMYESDESFGNIQSVRHVYLSGAYHFIPTYSESVITPHINMYVAPGTPFKMDIGVNYLHKNKISASLIFATGDALVLQAGYQYKQFIINYSYDIVVSRLRNVSSGAHEISLAMYIKPKEEGVSSPSF
ncbi:MAG TPA: PorP/SprF family type IX secretion system membrane protein [Bacteroidales bacterium]|nr:PorP/SprF family type IX secretion system membrane protein [Bacteroidales bacterium]HQL70286.1 PorP/SprF family type IX secretion system membrane protein [Bacteroidales bacterium]